MNIIFLIIIGSFVGAAAAYLGSFMVLRRMSLVGDALSHVALPGMAIALTLNFSPIIGAFVALAIAILGIWYLEEHSDLYPEALVGLFFTASLGIGVLVTPEPELLEALFGDIGKISPAEGVLAILTSLLIIFVASKISRDLILDTISEELAKSKGVNSANINLIYLFLVGLVVALGVKFVGTLLMGALVIIPAASAKNISLGIKNYYVYSIFFGVVSAILGLAISWSYQVSPGPVVVLVSIFFFVITFFLSRLVVKLPK